MRLPAVVLALPVAMLAAACSGGPDDDAVTGLVRHFHADIATGNFARACGLLAESTRDSLQYSEAQPCATALRTEGLPGGEVRSVEVFGRAAIVRTAADTVFVGEFTEGWRVTAAGCVQGEHEKFDCLLGTS